MARSTSRATQATVDSVHRLVGKELARQLKTDGPVSAALLATAISYLKLTGTDSAAQPRRGDALAATMPDMDDLERGMRPPAGA